MTRRSSIRAGECGPPRVRAAKAVASLLAHPLHGRVRPGARHGEGGQAAVEVVGLLPLLLAAGLAAAAILAALAAEEQAGQAAQAGAMALIQGGDPRAAARAALPAGARRRAAIAVRGRRVTVRVRPSLPVPGLAGEATAHAGPAPSAASAAASAALRHSSRARAVAAAVP